MGVGRGGRPKSTNSILGNLGFCAGVWYLPLYQVLFCLEKAVRVVSIFRNLHAIFVLCLCLLVSAKAHAMGGAECERFLLGRFDEALSHVDSVEDTRYEFSYMEGGHAWVGMIINVAYVSDDNPITKNISIGEDAEELQGSLFLNFKDLILKSGAYDKVFGVEFYRYEGVPVVAFNAVFEDVIDTYAISGSWSGLGFYFYRLYVVDNGAGGDSISMASISESLAGIVEECSSE